MEYAPSDVRLPVGNPDNGCGGLNTGDSSQVTQQITEVIGRALDGFFILRGDARTHYNQMLRPEAHVDFRQRDEAPKQDAGADSQHERNRDFSNYQSVSKTVRPATEHSFLSTLLKRFVQVHARSL